MAARRNHLAILLALTLGGCGAMPSLSLPDIKQRNDYVGKPLSAITSQLGWPEYQERMGAQKVYTWRRGTAMQTCYIKVIMAASGDVIESYEASGDPAICSPFDAKATD